MPRAAKSATKKPKAKKPAVAERSGPGYSLRVEVVAMKVNGKKMPAQLAAEAIAALLEKSMRKELKP